jgi:hypothetical protein
LCRRTQREEAVRVHHFKRDVDRCGGSRDEPWKKEARKLVRDDDRRMRGECGEEAVRFTRRTLEVGVVANIGGMKRRGVVAHPIYDELVKSR